MRKEKIDLIKKMKIFAIFVALLTLFFTNAFSMSHLAKLLYLAEVFK